MADSANTTRTIPNNGITTDDLVTALDVLSRNRDANNTRPFRWLLVPSADRAPLRAGMAIVNFLRMHFENEMGDHNPEMVANALRGVEMLLSLEEEAADTYEMSLQAERAAA